MPNLMKIVYALQGKKEGRDFRCECPIHGGSHLVVTDKRGNIQMNCMMGAKFPELVAALEERGLWEGSKDSLHNYKPSSNGNGHKPPPIPAKGQLAPRPTPSPPTAKKVAAEYIYRKNGIPAAVKQRIEWEEDGKKKKSFVWRVEGCEACDKHGHAKGVFQEHGLAIEDFDLYGAESIHKSDTVVFTEGEKAAWACNRKNVIAVCSGGGSGQKDFGKSLEALRDRDVVLFPDNSDDGRAYMLALKKLLTGIAQSVVFFVPPGLPEKGDAHEYFASHSKADFMRALREAPGKPSVTQTLDGYRVNLTTSAGEVRITFENLEERNHSLEADVTVWHKSETFASRLNLLSLSGKESFRRQLDDVFGKGAWTEVLNRSCEAVRTAHADQDPSVELIAAPIDESEKYIHYPLIAASGVTIFFGDDGSCKSLLAMSLGASIHDGSALLGCDPQQRNVLYVDYEDSEAVFKDRLYKLGVEQSFRYWPARGTPLPDLVPALRRRIRESEIGLLIVDSGGLACGGEPEKADVTLRFFAAIAHLEIPALVICHTTKAGEDKYPFGSRYWRSSSRLAWNVKKEQKEGASNAEMGLFWRKGNNDQPHKPVGVEVLFGDTTSFRRTELSGSFGKHTPLASQLWAELGDGAKTVKELADITNHPANEVRARLAGLNNVVQLGKGADGSRLWGRRASRED